MKTAAQRQTRPSRRFDSLEQEVFLNLWRTYDRLRALEDVLFSQSDLTPQQYNALRILKSEHPKSIHTLDLANRLVSRAPDITRLLDKLEQRGLVKRDRPSENRRVVLVGITAAGLLLLNELRLPIVECHGRQLGHMSQRQLTDLVALLREARKPHEIDKTTWKCD